MCLQLLPLLFLLFPFNEAVHESQVQLHIPSQAPSCSFNSYTALGDSYSAGFGADPFGRLDLCDDGASWASPSCTYKKCGKNTGSYAYQFYKQYNIPNFQYLACEGNDTLSILDDQVNGGEFGNPDLVTLNVGGDDSSIFSSIVIACVYVYNSDDCDKAMKLGNSTIQGLHTRLGSLYGAIKRKAPNATVAVLSYAQFWSTNLAPKDCGELVPFILEKRPSPAQILTMNALVVDINNILQTSARKAGFIFGNVDPLYDGHRFCTVKDETNYWFQNVPRIQWGNGGWDDWYVDKTVFHPYAVGQDAYLQLLKSGLGCS